MSKATTRNSLKLKVHFLFYDFVTVELRFECIDSKGRQNSPPKGNVGEESEKRRHRIGRQPGNQRHSCRSLRSFQTEDQITNDV